MKKKRIHGLMIECDLLAKIAFSELPKDVLTLLHLMKNLPVMYRTKGRRNFFLIAVPLRPEPPPSRA